MIAQVLSLAASESAANFSGGGVSWWQTLGGLLAVFGLLMVSLKLLGKLHRRTGSAEAGLLTVWPLGPKREIQVLRLGDDVHYIYRHENAMVLLKQEPLADYERVQQDGPDGTPGRGLKRLFPKGLPLSRTCTGPSGPAPDLISS